MTLFGTSSAGNASAAELLSRMAATYAGSATYIDVGEVRTTFFADDGPETTVRPFATAFDRRTGRFRFKYSKRCRHKGPGQRYVVWRSGGTVRTYWDVRPGVRSEESLGLALAGATGVSGGSAHTVPALLMPDEVGGRSLAELAGTAERSADQVVDGVVCCCVTGVISMSGGENDQILVLIDPRTFLVRRIVERTVLSGAAIEVESVTAYDARIDVEVPDDAFEFAMPSGGDT